MLFGVDATLGGNVDVACRSSSCGNGDGAAAIIVVVVVAVARTSSSNEEWVSEGNAVLLICRTVD